MNDDRRPYPIEDTLGPQQDIEAVSRGGDTEKRVEEVAENFEPDPGLHVGATV